MKFVISSNVCVLRCGATIAVAFVVVEMDLFVALDSMMESL